MRVLWRVIVKEFLQIRRDRKMIPVIFVAPIVQITVFGFAVNTDVTNVPTVLVDQDRSAASRDLVEPLRRVGLLRDRRRRRAGRRDRPLARDLAGPARPRDRPGLRRGARVVAARPRSSSWWTAATRPPPTSRSATRRAVVRELGAAVQERRLRAARGPAARRRPGRAGAARLLQPRPQEPLVLRAGRAGDDPDGDDDAALGDGRRAREGDRHAGAAHRHADPAVAAARRASSSRSP